MGLVIICVLLFGLSLAAERWLTVRREEKKIKEQLKNSAQPKEDNPVGQILLAHEKYKNSDMESLERKLSEIAVKYLPKVERGVGTIKLLAALAPLLGLLGHGDRHDHDFSIHYFVRNRGSQADGGRNLTGFGDHGHGGFVAPFLFYCAIILSQSRSQRVAQILEEQTAGLLARILIKDREKEPKR